MLALWQTAGMLPGSWCNNSDQITKGKDMLVCTPVTAVGLQSGRKAQVWRGSMSLRPAISHASNILGDLTTSSARTCSLPDRHSCRLLVVPLKSIGGATRHLTGVQAANLVLCWAIPLQSRLRLLLPTSCHDQ